MLAIKEIQVFLKENINPLLKVDSVLGNQSLTAINSFIEKTYPGVFKTQDKKLIVLNQHILKNKISSSLEVDGYFGQLSLNALEKYQSLQVRILSKVKNLDSCPFPVQGKVPDFYGKPNTSQQKLNLPYPMVVAWDKTKTINHFYAHEKVILSAESAFKEILAEYSLKGVKELGLDIFGGCLNVRKMKGSGKNYSMHSWGIAIDFDPENNQFRWGSDKARFARPEYNKFWEAWERRGWVSLGRERNFDWMHVQAATL